MLRLARSSKIGLLLVISYLFAMNAARAQIDGYTANQLLTSWRNLANGTVTNETFGLQEGLCIGSIRTAFMLGQSAFFCLPQGVSLGQQVRVFAAYANRNPHRTHEFYTKIIEASFVEAWPCQRR